jgi:hypothetical protein
MVPGQHERTHGNPLGQSASVRHPPATSHPRGAVQKQPLPSTRGKQAQGPEGPVPHSSGGQAGHPARHRGG